jgi:pilus assembly protein CpaE
VLRGILICPDEEMAAKLSAATLTTGEISIGTVLNRYPSGTDLTRALRAHAPEVVFLSFEQMDMAQAVVRFLAAESKGLQIVAIHRQMEDGLLRETMRTGVREFLAYPFERRLLMETIAATKGLLEREPLTSESTNQIFAFLPSKAGVGASTIALNVSAALAQVPDTRVLLSDFDLGAGMIRFMLKLQNEHSVADAMENAGRIDANLWPQLITAVGNLDVLHAGSINPSLCIETSQIRGLIDFARRHYQALCFDLSGNLERYSVEIMQDCRRILLVCTPEVPSLHQAREKVLYLKTLNLDTRVSVVLNRTHKKTLFSTEQVEQILGVPVVHSLANDYPTATKAMSAGGLIKPSTDLGKSFMQLAKGLLESRSSSKAVEGKLKFMELASLLSQKYINEGRQGFVYGLGRS